jgi:hypothetical protein
LDTIGHTRAAANGGCADRYHARRRPAERAIETGSACGIPVIDGRPEGFALEFEGIGELGKARVCRQHHVVELFQALFVEASRSFAAMAPASPNPTTTTSNVSAI